MKDAIGLLDPDAIARGLNPADPSVAAIAAGREALRRTAEYLKQTVDFAVETTLSGAGRLELIHKAKACGYEVFLAFAALNNPERNIARVRDRVAKGGHFVPEGDVRRRYMRSLETCLKRSVWQTRPNSMTTPVTVYASSSSPGAAS